MRALVIAMVLSLVASGGAFAGKKEHLDILWKMEEVKASEGECKKALSEGIILNSGIYRGSFSINHSITMSYGEHLYTFLHTDSLMWCNKKELILKKDRLPPR